MRMKEMQRLGSLAQGDEESVAWDEDFEEGKGDGTHEPEHFEGRTGYQDDFLERFPVPLPSQSPFPCASGCRGLSLPAW